MTTLPSNPLRALCLAAALLPTGPVGAAPEPGAFKPDREFQVSVTTPATNYKVEIKGVYQVGDEVWVVSKVGTVGDIGGAAISKVSDKVTVDRADLPAGGKFKVRHKVTGKSWNWDEKGDGVEHVAKADEAELKKKLAGGKKIPFKR